MFVLTALEKIIETRLKFSQRCVKVLKKIANYQETNYQYTINKLKTAAKNRIGTMLRLNKKKFENEELPHELFQTTRKTASKLPLLINCQQI